MATRKLRLSEFNQDPPPPGQPLQLLCEDHNGTYFLPFRCEWRDGAWYASDKTNPLEARVVGWRSLRY
jgi:hypothetical protein